MGITLTQYRASIGVWAGRGLRKISKPITKPNAQGKPPVIDSNSRPIKGPWKMHATVLVYIIVFLLIGPTYTNATTLASSSSSQLIIADPETDVISASCLKALLQIGGVELNPGPSIADVLAELAALAPDNDVRHCIRAYRADDAFAKQYQALNKYKKATIEATAEYLNLPAEDMKKSAQVTRVIVRIQNLLPDSCQICKEDYCLKRDELPLLSCDICKQGCHNECIRKHLSVPDELAESFGPQEAISQINPTGMPGIYYLCGACSSENIPTKEVGLGSSLDSSQLSNDRDLSSLQEHEEESEFPTASQLNQNHDDRNDETSLTNPAEPDTAAGDGDEEEEDFEDATTVVEQPLPQNQQNQNKYQKKTNNICRYYKMGKCKHGLKGHNCPKEHPPACKKLLKHGNRGPEGCTLGSKCEHYHPKMCLSSLKRKVCYRNDCKFVHTTGTRRKKDKPESAQENRTDAPTVPSSTAPARKTQTESNPFLEALQAMREEIMKELDSKLASLHVPNPMSLNQPNLRTEQLQTAHFLAGGQNQLTTGGQMLGTNQTQGVQRGQHVVHLPMLIPH